MELGGLTPEMLDAFLRVLKDNEVSDFMGMGIHVRFFPETPEFKDSPKDKREAPRSMWENESLWPGGEPPTFTGKAK